MTERSETSNVQLKFRVKESLRAGLEKAARDRGVSMNAEIVARLEQSFREQDFLDRLLGDDPAIRTMAMLMVSALRRGGQLGANARGHPEWTPSEWLTDSFSLVVAGYSVMQALGVAEPHREDLPSHPTIEQVRECGYRLFARAVAANVPVEIPPYAHPSEKSEGST